MDNDQEDTDTETEETNNPTTGSNTTSSARALHSVINNTSIGWENIIPSALHVCITLIETSPSLFGRPSSSSMDGICSAHLLKHNAIVWGYHCWRKHF